MNRNHPIIKGTLILTVSGLLTRLIGFLYRIFLSNLIGAKQLGVYQMIFPVLALLFSFTSSGCQLVISRRVAAGESDPDGASPGQVLGVGLFLSLALCIPAMLLLRCKSEFLAVHLLSEEGCAPLLRIAALALPLSAIHMCVEGYYYGQQKTFVTAFTNLAEQLVRVLSVWLLYQIAIQEGRPVTVSIAVYGLVLGEASSALISLTALSFQKREKNNRLSRRMLGGLFRSFFTQGVPLTLNRVLLGLLQSAEAILLPAALVRFGLTSDESLTVYGVLTGMAMPFILFPSALTNAASAMLLPSAAKAQASENEKSLRHTTAAAVRAALLLGILCTGVFVTFGPSIGETFFQNALAGEYLQILGWICPLMYLSSTCASILHGLGKTAAVFTANFCVMLLRLIFVLFAVPYFGILSYFWGILVCHLLFATICLTHLCRTLAFSFDVVSSLVRPTLCMLAACLTCRSIAQRVLADGLIGTCIAVFLCCCLYFAALLLFGDLRLTRRTRASYNGDCESEEEKRYDEFGIQKKITDPNGDQEAISDVRKAARHQSCARSGDPRCLYRRFR